MNIEVLLFFLIGALSFIGFLFSGLNRTRGINDKLFFQKTERLLQLQKGDQFNTLLFTRTYMMIRFIQAALILGMVLFTYFQVDGTYVNLTEVQLQTVTTSTIFLVFIFVSNTMLMGYIRERSVTRVNKSNSTKISLYMLVITIVIFVSFLYSFINLF